MSLARRQGETQLALGLPFAPGSVSRPVALDAQVVPTELVRVRARTAAPGYERETDVQRDAVGETNATCGGFVLG